MKTTEKMSEDKAKQENVVNHLTEHMSMAINKAMGKTEESYDEFMKGFQHITKENVTSQENRSCSDISATKPNHLPPERSVVAISKINNETSKSSTSKMPDPRVKPVDKEDLSGDELEEEVLDQGTTTKSRTLETSSSRVKFDNFVDEEMSDEEPSGYVASFSQDAEKENVDHCSNDNNKTKPESNSPQNFQPDDTDHFDLNSEVVTEKKQKLTLDKDNNTLCDDDQKGDVQTVEMLGPSDQQMSLYPGEAEPENEVKGQDQANHTHLDFAVVTCQSCVQNEQMNTDSAPDAKDEVQPFSLDDDFDYDNVTLTPKFTPAEVEHLRSFLPVNKVQV